MHVNKTGQKPFFVTHKEHILCSYLQKCGAKPGHWSPHFTHFLSGSSTGAIVDMLKT